MTFKDLYNHSLETMTRLSEGGSFRPITVNELKAFAKSNVGWIEDINFWPVEARSDDPFGHFECHGTQESRWEDPEAWVVLITYDDDPDVLNICGQRFVWAKELMHIFDSDDCLTSSREAYFELLSDIETKPLDPSGAYRSENAAKWMALLALCPKPFRDEAVDVIENDGITHYEIALKYRIPEAVVSSLISRGYDRAYHTLLR